MMTMRRPRLVLFDCDGTLVDSQHVICAAMADAFGACGLEPPPREAVLSIVGLSLTEAMGRLAASVEPAAIERLVACYRTAFQQACASPQGAQPLFEGALEAVTALASRDDVVLGIVTGKSRRGLERVLDATGLASYFHVRQTADDAPSKPHPGMVLQAMAATGIAAQDTLVIGDTVFDIEMAAAAEAAPIGVAWGYHPPGDLHAAGARYVLNRFDELHDAIEALSASDSRRAQAP